MNVEQDPEKSNFCSCYNTSRENMAWDCVLFILKHRLWEVRLSITLIKINLFETQRHGNTISLTNFYRYLFTFCIQPEQYITVMFVYKLRCIYKILKLVFLASPIGDFCKINFFECRGFFKICFFVIYYLTYNNTMLYHSQEIKQLICLLIVDGRSQDKTSGIPISSRAQRLI